MMSITGDVKHLILCFKYRFAFSKKTKTKTPCMTGDALFFLIREQYNGKGTMRAFMVLPLVVPLVPIALSGNTLCVSYRLCIRHTLGTVFELHQSSENTHRYFQIIETKNTYRPSYAA